MYTLEISKNELNIYKTLQSGQVFHYEINDNNNEFILIYQDNFVEVKETSKGYDFFCDEFEFNSIWKEYLDLNRNYYEINDNIMKVDIRLKEVISQNLGVRILKQDSFEMLITFILSQSKSIPQIRSLVNMLSVNYGRCLGTINNKVIYSFPKVDNLKHLSAEDFRSMKVGYRAPYLVDAVLKYEEINQYSVNSTDIALKSHLMTIHGVGEKVASCVMLFGYNRFYTFPIDVWMRRIMLDMYSDRFKNSINKIKDKDIENLGLNLFGANAGMAQQYLFEYGRRN